MRYSKIRTVLLAGCATVALSPTFALAQSQPQPRVSYDIPAQDLGAALTQFGQQSEREIVFSADLARNKKARPVAGEMTSGEALAMLLADTGLTYRTSSNGSIIVEASDPQSGSAAGDGADSGTVQALIVTAQKREEDIQDVPIAISAFTQEDLTRSQVAGGPDLVTQVPNFTFTKTNFSSYSIQIRGIGTQAISATTDPAVAVAFNNTPFIRNRFFEQEFYDLERVEVLRGPQGTLYGRNATGGVVNIISAKPKFRYEAKLSADVGNFSSSRIEGMLNIPLVEDKAALRFAGAWTKRDGYATNEITSNPIDGRDLWSTRVSLRIAPNDRLSVNLIWEHFQEDDDRLRSGKQLCKKDVVTSVAGFPVTNYYAGLPNTGQAGVLSGPEATFSQGCTRQSLYDNSSFQRPNGLMLPYYVPLSGIGLPIALQDPYVSFTNSSDPAVIASVNDQPEDLRVIQSMINPKYRARNDLGELQISYDINDGLTLTSETAYSTDRVYSMQDFNRFNTASGAWEQARSFDREGVLLQGPNGGIFCDPQLGCSDRLVAVDVSTAKARQFSQEFRLASNYQGPFNFSLGANFLRGDSEDKYYVFINSLSLKAALGNPFFMLSPYVAGQTDNIECMDNGYVPGDPNGVYPVTGCIYMDPNPIESVNDQGHNYFLSNNPYKLISYAIFGEAYYKLAENLKITAGLRWTVDKKDAPRIPTWVLGSNSVGYPVAEVIQQEWREPTGRLAIDWKPHLSFTDETLVYASYAHGYKAGGANPPGFVRVFYSDASVAQSQSDVSATRPKTFDPEFVNAFEVGSKNTFLNGKATANIAAFYYDYTGYQVSEIVDRSAFNRNFDATVWGVELEGDWRPLENLRFGLKAGYEKTRIANSEQAIDLMDRTAGNPDWVLVRPFPTYASSCILPAWLFAGHSFGSPTNPNLVNLGGASGGNPGGCELAYILGVDPVTREAYTANPTGGAGALGVTHIGTINYTTWSTDPNAYPGVTWANGVVTDRTYPGWDPATAPNHGEGIMKPLGGNELPNAPHFTATVTGDYTLPLGDDWLMTLHSDVHWQSQSWWRVFNDSTYDKLHPYFTMNLAAIFNNEDAGWNIMAYIKNVTDETAITGAFLNSDDTGLTTNVFLTEPRLYGLRVTKNWSGGSGGWLSTHEGPNPFTVEVGGQLQRHDAPNSPLAPSYGAAFTGPLDVFPAAQAKDLDWGNGGEVRVTWRPSAAAWSLSAGMRYGKTNGASSATGKFDTDPVCAFAGSFASRCQTKYNDPTWGPFTHFSKTNQADATVWDREQYKIADFSVGRDVGLGGLDRSQFTAGLRYAGLESETKGELRGVPDWNVQEGFFRPNPGHVTTHTVYDIKVSDDRTFKGFGPEANWDASTLLMHMADGGHMDLDWSVGGAVLIGRQEVSITGDQQAWYVSATGLQIVFPGQVVPPVPVFTTGPAIDIHRSRSATVPTANASLGLSYKVGGFTAGAGYRWERYFNAIDGGYDQHKSYDRTIDGPYFKVSVGFGG